MRGCLLSVALVLGLTTLAFASDSGRGAPPSGGPGGRPPSGGEMKLPQEAITACSGKSAGDTCLAGQAGDGVCEYTPDKKYFACKPNNMPSGGPGGSSLSDSSGMESSSTLVK